MKNLQKQVVRALLAIVLVVLLSPIQVGADTCQMDFRKNSKVAFVCDKSYKLDVAPFVSDNNIFLPFRFFFERFATQVDWVDKHVNLSYEGNSFVHVANTNISTINGKPVYLTKNSIIKNGRLFLAVKDMVDVGKMMGLATDFTAKTDSVQVSIEKTKIKYLWNDFTRPIMDGNGKTLTLSKVMTEPDTKAVIVQVWHTGCAGCVDVLKLFQKLWVKYQDKGLKIVSINTDGPGYEEGRAERIELSGVTYPVVLDETYSLKPYWYDPIFPNYYLLVPGDKYIRIFQERWDEAVNEIFEKTVGDLCSGN